MPPVLGVGWGSLGCAGAAGVAGGVEPPLDKGPADDRLTAPVHLRRERPLRAPVEGSMGRTIHESLCAGVRYRFWHGGTLLFCHTDYQASFEYAD